MSYFGAARRQAAKPSERRGFRPKRRQTGGGGRSPRTGGLRGWFAAVDWDRFRFRMVAVLFCVIWAALWARAGYIQLWNGAQLAERARRQHTSAEHVETPRGMILDRNGQILARSVEVRSVYANPGQVGVLPRISAPPCARAAVLCGSCGGWTTLRRKPCVRRICPGWVSSVNTNGCTPTSRWPDNCSVLSAWTEKGWKDWSVPLTTI